MPLNFFKKKSYVGVDIGHKSVKIAQIEKTGSSWKVLKVASAPLPDECVAEGIVTDIDMVSLVLKGALREHKFHASAAVIGVSGGSAIVRTVRVPKMNEQMLRKSIRYEAGRYVPSSIEDSFIEFAIIGDAEEEQMDVLIVAAPREIVESRVKAVEKAGLEVDVVDINAFALYRSLVESDEESMMHQLTVALVDIGSYTTTVSVVDNGVFAMTRTIAQGGQTWTDAIKQYFKLSDEDAEEGKAALDLRPLLGDAILDNQPLRVIQQPVDDLIREIRRSLNYYQTQQNSSGQPQAVTHLVVSGGGALLDGVGDYLGHKLGMQVICQGVLDNPRFENLTGLDHGGHEYSVVTGLAMRAFAKSA
ncbi:type IV pilus assembly protein PilM [Kamptonema cortianum]|nr:type IV pilus assembly protein PilM [Geitlerinema splendidum]MDK3155299.1 type IV pilus assembly protein PilM [Kamptonema cortianum]